MSNNVLVWKTAIILQLVNEPEIRLYVLDIFKCKSLDQVDENI